MKKIIVWIAVLISILILLVRFSSKAAEILFGIKQVSGISVISVPEGATVSLDNKEAGKTPYENKDLEVREYLVKLDKDGASWQGKVKLTAQTVTVINRDLAKEQASSSGEILTLEKGRGMTVVSNPSDSEIEIDGKVYGKTPLSINIEKGEHTIAVSHPNYLKRSIRVNLPSDFNLTVSVDLSLSEADLKTVTTPVISQTPEVVVTQTPTGFLRVREKGSLSAKEIGRINEGDTLILLEELSGWYRVRTPDGKEGYVSATYVQKKKTSNP